MHSNEDTADLSHLRFTDAWSITHALIQWEAERDASGFIVKLGCGRLFNLLRRHVHQGRDVDCMACIAEAAKW
jgi:hypothetical protein